jgi:hypothetical protein
MAFGDLRDRVISQAEHQARYRAERKRQEAKFEFEQFCTAQRARIAATLKQQTDRVNAARWGNPHDGDGLFVVTRHGTTEISAPVKRMYQEQGS